MLVHEEHLVNTATRLYHSFLKEMSGGHQSAATVADWEILSEAMAEAIAGSTLQHRNVDRIWRIAHNTATFGTEIMRLQTETDNSIDALQRQLCSLKVSSHGVQASDGSIPGPEIQQHATASRAKDGSAEPAPQPLLRRWFYHHLAYPFPSASQKLAMSQLLTHTKKSVEGDMTNWRRRSGFTAICKRFASNDLELMRIIIERVIIGHPYPLPGNVGPRENEEVRDAVDRVRRYARGEDEPAGGWLAALPTAVPLDDSPGWEHILQPDADVQAIDDAAAEIEREAEMKEKEAADRLAALSAGAGGDGTGKKRRRGKAATSAVDIDAAVPEEQDADHENTTNTAEGTADGAEEPTTEVAAAVPTPAKRSRGSLPTAAQKAALAEKRRKLLKLFRPAMGYDDCIKGEYDAASPPSSSSSGHGHHGSDSDDEDDENRTGPGGRKGKKPRRKGPPMTKADKARAQAESREAARARAAQSLFADGRLETPTPIRMVSPDAHAHQARGQGYGRDQDSPDQASPLAAYAPLPQLYQQGPVCVPSQLVFGTPSSSPTASTFPLPTGARAGSHACAHAENNNERSRTVSSSSTLSRVSDSIPTLPSSDVPPVPAVPSLLLSAFVPSQASTSASMHTAAVPSQITRPATGQAHVEMAFGGTAEVVAGKKRSASGPAEAQGREGAKAAKVSKGKAKAKGKGNAEEDEEVHVKKEREDEGEAKKGKKAARTVSAPHATAASISHHTAVYQQPAPAPMPYTVAQANPSGIAAPARPAPPAHVYPAEYAAQWAYSQQAYHPYAHQHPAGYDYPAHGYVAPGHSYAGFHPSVVHPAPAHGYYHHPGPSRQASQHVPGVNATIAAAPAGQQHMIIHPGPPATTLRPPATTANTRRESSSSSDGSFHMSAYVHSASPSTSVSATASQTGSSRSSTPALLQRANINVSTTPESIQGTSTRTASPNSATEVESQYLFPTSASATPASFAGSASQQHPGVQRSFSVPAPSSAFGVEQHQIIRRHSSGNQSSGGTDVRFGSGMEWAFEFDPFRAEGAQQQE